MEITQRRTAMDFAHCLKRLVDGLFPQAAKIRVVLDRFSRHPPAPLYTVFESAEFKRIVRRLTLHFTPKSGLWLNAVKTEFSALPWPVMDRWSRSLTMLCDVVSTWAQARGRIPMELN